MQTAIRINVETQAKLGRMDVSETALFNEAFSLNATKPDAPRLRLAEDDGSKTYENLHRGARAFAEGLYAAIRNPGVHTPEQSDGDQEQLALEHLAAFSLLARWVDQAQVETVSLTVVPPSEAVALMMRLRSISARLAAPKSRSYPYKSSPMVASRAGWPLNPWTS